MIFDYCGQRQATRQAAVRTDLHAGRVPYL